MTNNLKRTFLSMVIAVVFSTVLLAKDINETADTPYEIPVQIGIVQVFSVSSEQSKNFLTQMKSYKIARQQLEANHQEQIDFILGQ